MAEFPRDFGAYTLLAELGRGGMGTVYKAEQKSLGRAVALKVLNVSRDWAGDDTLTRFQREGEIMARLTHPDIVAVHDLGVHEEKLYISMDLVGGQSLDRWLHSRYPTLEQSLAIVARVARALYVAHEQGIIHRDIKPSNILIDYNGNPKLSDFGLAKVDGAKLSQSGSLLGTPMYMSPEQAAGDAVDARSDLYSLGAVLYELLTGGPPVTGTSVEAIVHAVVHGTPIPPRVVNPKIPRDVETICLKAMAKSREQRYTTAAAFAEDIDRYLRGQSILARRPSLVERAWYWAKRNRMAVAVSAVALSLAAAGAAVSIRLSSRLEAQRQRTQEKEELEATAAQAERLYRMQAYAEAIPHFLKLKDTPLDLPARKLQRAISLREAGKREEAEGEFATYTALLPEDATGWRHRGLNALERGNLADAIRWYREAARLARIPIADEADRFGDFDALIAIVERHYVHDHPRALLASYTPHYDFGRRADFRLFQHELPDSNWLLSEWHDRFPVASDYKVGIDQWIEKFGEHPALIGWRASLILDAKPNEALVDLDRVLQLVPIVRWARYMKVRAHLLLRQFEQAERESDTLALLCPKDPYTRHNIASTRVQVGDFGRASRDYETMAEAAQHTRVPYGSSMVLYEEATKCAARAGNGAEAARLARLARKNNVTSLGNPRRIESDPTFVRVIDTPEFREFLDSLDPYNAAFLKGLDRVSFDPWKDFPAGGSCTYRMVRENLTLDALVYCRRDDADFPHALEFFRDGEQIFSGMIPPIVRKEAAPVSAGEETVRVPRGEFRCRKTVVSVPGGEAQIWLSDDVPFLLVKKVTTVSGRTTTIELVDIQRP